jgi:hypothetical protein
MRKLLSVFTSLFVTGAFGMTINSSKTVFSSESLGPDSQLKAVVLKMEAPPKVLSNMTCFSTKWFDMEEFKSQNLQIKLEELKALNSDAFYTIDENGEKLQCFIANQLKNAEKKLLDSLLSAVDKAVDSEVLVVIPSEKEKEISNYIQEDEAVVDQEQRFLDIAACEGYTDTLAVHKEDFSFMRNHDASLLRKLGRAELIVGGVEVLGMGTLLLLPKSITKWEGDFLAKAKNNYKRAWSSAPVWDKDEWAINYIGHPYAGAVYYNALRSQNASPLASFLFSTAQSVIWEYGIEAAAEQPSIQDLLFTSTIGSALGELAHKATLKMRKGGMTFGEKVIITIINPSYLLNNGYDPSPKKKKYLF